MKAGQLSLLFLILFYWNACDDSGGTKQGDLGQECYPNGTCNQGLLCDEGKCVAENTNNTSNTNNSTNTSTTNNTTNAGDLGGPCLVGDLCNGDLVCENGICIEDETIPGALNGPCIDGECNVGLVCAENICLTDQDGDGYHEGADCDDNDDTVHPGTIIECEGECDLGLQSCLDDGTWSQCSADNTDCACAEPGLTDTVTCGYCGTAERLCEYDFTWSLPQECLNQGPCLPGSSETESCGNCGERTRFCDNGCEWGEWGACENEGVCNPGLELWVTDDCTALGYVRGAMRQRICDNTCQWNDAAGCTETCPGTPRAAGTMPNGDPDFKEEICIPLGDTILVDKYSDPLETLTVTLSPYYIDKYEVTNARYQECVDAGVCAAIPFATDERNWPVAVPDYNTALTFCHWDGGRTIPTESQWSMAGRGPVPQLTKHVWGDNDGTCDEVTASDCPESTGERSDVNLNPLGVSYYGLYRMEDNVTELCYDDYNYNFPVYDTTLNPVGTSSGRGRLNRGFSYLNPISYYGDVFSMDYRGERHEPWGEQLKDSDVQRALPIIRRQRDEKIYNFSSVYNFYSFLLFLRWGG